MNKPASVLTIDTVTSTYSNRKRVALSLQQPSDVWTNWFGWDLAGRLYSVSSPAGTFSYNYTALDPNFSGRLVQQLSLPSGAYISDFYDPVARLLGTVLTSSVKLMRLHYKGLSLPFVHSNRKAH